jgi:thiol:disulfide interchange protein
MYMRGFVRRVERHALRSVPFSMPETSTVSPPPTPTQTPRRSTNWVLVIGIVAVVLILAWPMLSERFRPIPPDHIPWRTDYTAALAEAKQTGKPVLLDFAAPWCPPCNQMKRYTWPDPRVRDAVVEKTIPVKIDFDSRQDLVRAYRVEGIPAVLLVDEKGLLIRKPREGYQEPEQILDMLR